LPPVRSAPRGPAGAGFADSLWNGLSAVELEERFLGLSLPLRSPVLQDLLIRALLTETAIPEGAQGRPGYFLALRLEILRRTGHLEKIVQLAERSGAPNRWPALQAYYAYALLGLGDRDRACGEANAIPVSAGGLPRRTVGLALALVAYCFAADGQFGAAQLNLELARDHGLDVDTAENGLANLAAGTKSRIRHKGRIDLPGYMFLRLAEWSPSELKLKQAEPSVILAIARDGGLDEGLRLEALEEAARTNIVQHSILADAYLRHHFDPASSTGPNDDRTGVAFRRARLYQALKGEWEPLRRLRLVKSILDTARKNGLFRVLAKLTAKPAASLPLSPEFLGFGETLVEAAAAAGDFRRALDWLVLAGSSPDVRANSLSHWLVLLEIGQSDGRLQADRDLRFTTRDALAGRFGPEMLHRLVTVLDALQYDVPIPLWDAASRRPQPNEGHLPETGALSRLQEAAKRGEVGKTLLLAMAALGPDGPGGAHMIALGDAIRALKMVGLEAEARQVGFEALFAIWPRQAGH